MDFLRGSRSSMSMARLHLLGRVAGCPGSPFIIDETSPRLVPRKSPRGTPMAAPLPSDMTVIEIVNPGGPEALQPKRRPVPAPGPGEVLIQVAAAGVNRPDVL